MHGRLSVAVLSGLIALGGCAPTASATPAPSRRATPQPTPRPSPSPTATPHGLATCPPSSRENQLAVFARTGGSPDDLAPALDGGLWVTDQPNNHVIRLDAQGGVVATLSDGHGPEGIVPQPDGTLILAEQRLDRIVQVQPPSMSPLRVIAQLQMAAGQLGLDSIEVDRSGDRLLIPDSARGALRALPLSGGPLTTLAVGLGRPVDAVLAADGFIYVTAENTPGLTRVPASGGAPVRVGTLVNLDDVLAVGSLLYVTDLQDGSLRAIDPATGDARTLVTGIAQPQGIALLPDGRLVVSDSSRGILVALPAC